MIHDNTIIEDNVRIYQNVTLGRADVYKSEKDSPSEFKGFLLKEGACICAGAKLICKKGTLVIGKNAVVGANAVLLNSIGDNEIWGGLPLLSPTITISIAYFTFRCHLSCAFQ